MNIKTIYVYTKSVIQIQYKTNGQNLQKKFEFLIFYKNVCTWWFFCLSQYAKKKKNKIGFRITKYVYYITFRKKNEFTKWMRHINDGSREHGKLHISWGHGRRVNWTEWLTSHSERHLFDIIVIFYHVAKT